MDETSKKPGEGAPGPIIDEPAGLATQDARALEAEAIRRAAETGGRLPKAAWLKWSIFAIAIVWSCFQVWATWVGGLDQMRLAGIHLSFGFALAFLAYPTKRGPRGYVPWYDWLLAAAGIAGAAYIVIDFYGIIVMRGGVAIERDVILGAMTLAVLYVATYRVAGPALVVISGLLIAYAFMGPRGLLPITPPGPLLIHPGFSVTQVVQELYLTANGLWGTPIMVSATFVFLFVLFGALLDRAGAGRYFVNLAFSAVGQLRGGPAKAAVIASLFTGIISGSSISNVVTTGTFTIPIMKRVGYPAYKAAAVEVAASTNGQLMPPIMGAAAFIMAEFIGIPYAQLILYALIPALLSYAALLYVVHLEAMKLGLKGVPRSELPPFLPTFLSGVHYMIPVIFLIYNLVIVRFTPERSVLNSMFLLIVLMLVQEVWRAYRARTGLWAGLKSGAITIVGGFETGARNMTSIAIATATAGIIVGIVTLTGLGIELPSIVETLSGGNLYAVLVLSAVAGLLMGMGLPTTANYIVMAALIAPVILQLSRAAGYDVPIVAVHLFVFYFGILADDTPPVGLAAFAGAAIARSNPVQTGIQSFIYDMRTAILPFIFFFNPELLLIGVDSFWEGAWVIVTAGVGILAFAASLQGWLLTHMTWFERIPLLAGALVTLVPGAQTDMIGIAILLVISAIQYYKFRREQVREPAPA
jgi:TRAP transporter 4TM/12TM fusion protein